MDGLVRCHDAFARGGLGHSSDMVGSLQVYGGVHVKCQMASLQVSGGVHVKWLHVKRPVASGAMLPCIDRHPRTE